MKIAKVDKNQSEIVAIFRSFGFSVFHTHTVGQGFPDIAIGRHGLNWLIEIKNGDKAKLTEKEDAFLKGWKGRAFIVRSIEEAVSLAKQLP